MAVDATGNVYVPANNGIRKYDPAGNLVYSNAVPLNAEVRAIAADFAGNVVLAGQSSRDDVPTTPGVFQPQRNNLSYCVTGDRDARHVPCSDIVVAKLDAAGNLAWATYLGGIAEDQAMAVAVDAAGDIYVTGITQSYDFPHRGGFQSKFGGYGDAFVTKLSGDGARVIYSSFIGGEAYDAGHAIAVDSAGSAYVAGDFAGPGLAATPGSFGVDCASNGLRAFLLKIAPAGDHVVFGGCLGAANAASSATAVALDGSGNVHLGGYTNGEGFPSTPGAFRSQTRSGGDFLMKISADGSTIVYSSLFDGASFGIYSIAVDRDGAMYAAGDTWSANLPITGPAMQPCADASSLEHNFVLKLNADGTALQYLSYEDPNWKVHLALDSEGALYEAAGTLRKILALEQSGPPQLSRLCVLHGATFASHVAYGQPGISPGEVVTLKGAGLAPVDPVSAPVTDDIVGTSASGVQVLFDGVPAPLLYAQDRQINVIAPYAIGDKSETTIQVIYGGQTAVPVTIPVSAASPALLGIDTPIPATRGGVVRLILTGGGQTNPASVDGQIWRTAGGLAAEVTAQVETVGPASGLQRIPVKVLYAGPVVGAVSAVQEVDVQLPADLVVPVQFPGGGPGVYLNVTAGTRTVNAALAIQ